MKEGLKGEGWPREGSAGGDGGTNEGQMSAALGPCFCASLAHMSLRVPDAWTTDGVRGYIRHETL